MVIRTQTSLTKSEAIASPIIETIDIEFWGIDYVDIPTSFEGLSIQVEAFSNNPKLLNYKEREAKLFKIVSGTMMHYIVAAGCVIGKSHWINEDRLANFSLNYDEVLMKF
jgi:hypothetical protein